MTKIMGDMDGCMDNYVDAFRDCVSEQRKWSLNFGREVMGPAESWSFYKQSGWEMTTAEFLEAMRYATIHQDLSGRAKPYPGAIDAIKELYYRGHEIYIVSSRLYGPDTIIPAYQQTWDWLDTYGLPPMKLMIIGAETSKADVCLANDLTVAIEDSPAQYEELTRAGIDCYLMDQAWNRDVEAINKGKVRRVFSWEDILKAIL